MAENFISKINLDGSLYWIKDASVDEKIESKIGALQASLVGGDGKYIKSISESSGVITAVEGNTSEFDASGAAAAVRTATDTSLALKADKVGSGKENQLLMADDSGNLAASGINYENVALLDTSNNFTSDVNVGGNFSVTGGTAVFSGEVEFTGDIAIASDQTLDASGATVLVGTPTAAGQAANKGYVDLADASLDASISALKAATDASLALKEDVANKKTSLDSSSSVYYPTTGAVKAVTDALDARIDDLSALGRFLSTWNCVTGLPDTNPTTSPYAYKTGDYYVVSKVDASALTNNLIPDGSSYTIGTASTKHFAGEALNVNDIYRYDGSTWTLLHMADRKVAWGAITGDLANQTDLKNALDAKASKVSEGNENKLILADASGDIKASAVSVDNLALLDAANNAFDGNISVGGTLSVEQAATFTGIINAKEDIYMASGKTLDASAATVIVATPTADNEAVNKAYVDGSVNLRYIKPAAGIPETDLDASVQAKLNKVFVALYASTEYSEVLAAYNAGKTIFVKLSAASELPFEGDAVYPLTNKEDGGFYFGGVGAIDGAEYSVKISLDDSGGWEIAEIELAKQTVVSAAVERIDGSLDAFKTSIAKLDASVNTIEAKPAYNITAAQVTKWDSISDGSIVKTFGGEDGAITVRGNQTPGTDAAVVNLSMSGKELRADVSGLGTAAFKDVTYFALVSHSHAIADVSGLQTALDGKVNNTVKIAGNALTGDIDSSTLINSLGISEGANKVTFAYTEGTETLVITVK